MHKKELHLLKKLEVTYHERSREILKRDPVQYLATVGRDGKAKCPFMFAGEMDGRLWFCTNTKDVYKDMQADPNIEVSVSSPTYAWIA